MTTLATDDFNRTNGVIGANWTNNNGSWVVSSNAAKPNTAGVLNLATFTGAGAFPNNQWAQAVVGNLSTGRAPAICARVGATGGYGFFKAYGGTGWSLNTFDGTGLILGAALASGANVVANGSTMYIDAVGTTIRAVLDGGQLASVTDATFSAGYPGIDNYSDDALETFDSFAAGDFSVSPVPILDSHQRRRVA